MDQTSSSGKTSRTKVAVAILAGVLSILSAGQAASSTGSANAAIQEHRS